MANDSVRSLYLERVAGVSSLADRRRDFGDGQGLDRLKYV